MIKIIMAIPLLGVLTCIAGPALAYEYPDIPPYIEMYSGVSLLDAEDSPRSSYTSPLQESRAGTKKAFEYESEDTSLLLGGLVEAFPLPQRFYLEAHVADDDDWFGEVQHSYKDIYQFRLLSRRFVHNLDNLTLHNVGPMLTPPLLPGSLIDRQDVGQDYGLDVDIDHFKLRLKTPNFPLHLYTEGEVVRRDGSRQLRFLGGSSDNSSDKVRVSQALGVDQESREITVGVNSHLRWIEADISHARQEFENDVAVPHYAYLAAGTVRDAGLFPHSQLPELEASRNTLKVHTVQTGRVFASATLADLERTNNSSGAEAERELGHGELMWTPLANLVLGTKFRHQENKSAGPPAVATNYSAAGIPFSPARVQQGVEAGTNTVIAFLRYAPFSKLTLKGQYDIERLARDQESAVAWHLAEERDTETIDLGLAWRPRRDLKVNTKYIYKDTDVDAGAAVIFNNDPEKTHQYSADITYFPTAKTSLLLSAMLKEDTAGNLQILDSELRPWVDPIKGGVDDYDARWRRYLTSISHSCTERVSVAVSYAYSIMETDRDFGMETGVLNSFLIDEGYRNEQDYHNIGFSASFLATDRLTLEAMVDFTRAAGDYTLTEPLLVKDLSIGAISQVDTEELGVRLDGEYELGQGWKTSVILRYVDWVDKSFDNPAMGEIYGALFKISKAFL